MKAQTIKEYLLSNELKNCEKRLNQLKEMNAPDATLAAAQKQVENLKSGDLEISGDTELLKERFESRKVAKGRGGKIYLIINDEILYFPQARYGRYITKKKDRQS